MSFSSFKNALFVNIPNMLTTFRLIVSVWLFFLIKSNDSRFSLVLLLLLLAILSDFLDGRFARKYQLTSKAGAFLDRLADKMLICPMIIILVFVYFPSTVHYNVMVFTLAMAILISILELILLISGFISLITGFNIASNKWGKRKMALQSAAVSLWFVSLVIEYYSGQSVMSFVIYIINIIFILSAGLAVMSINGYLQEYLNLKRKPVATALVSE